jgi:type I restriction-modification system DNA methylase subunit
MFQKTILSKYLKNQNQVELLEKWKVFQAHFQDAQIQENIRQSKEEQYQGEFLIDLFVNILGYIKNPTPNFNITTELKNVKDSKKADGAIIIEGNVVAIIELKGTNTTDLSKVEDQAFNYKNSHDDKFCKYVIISNFEKLRFYIGNKNDFEEFNLFDLNFERFKLLYLILSLDNITNDIPQKLKEESLNQEDIVTKKLYKDYSVFKRELFQNLTQLNPEHDPLVLFQKSQKLLDRLLFLFFGEDRGLLPPNSVRKILEQWNKLQELDEYTPLYSRYKKYFGYLNTGYKGKNHDVFAYNGGLFKEDEILDTIKIDDDLLYKHTFKLSEYDFASEVDVNILGHIFENSLNEIDEIKAQLAGEEIDKSKTKRKKDGVFYTPKYITKYIVENTVGKLCEEKKTEFEIVEEDYFTDKKRQEKTKKLLLNKLDAYRKWLLQITIVDPACGSGAFLNEALNFLIAEHQYIDELEAKLRNVPIIFSYHSESILEHNLFGVDLNEESVEIAKLSLWLRTAEPNRKLNSLNNNIKCGNSLIDDPEVAGNKAFNWEEEFPQVFAKGGFDVVIGNPPYVLCQPSNTNENILEFYKTYEVASYKIDLFHLFFEKAINILKLNGKLGFITPNTYLSNKYIQKLRNFILNNTFVEEVVNYNEIVFVDAGVDVATVILTKKNEQNGTIKIFNSENGNLKNITTKSQNDWNNDEEQTFNLKNNFIFEFTHCLNFGDIGNTYFGIQAYDRKSSISNEKLENHFTEIIDGGDIVRYQYAIPNKFFNFLPERIKSGGDWNVYNQDRIVISQIGQFPKVGFCKSQILTSNTIYNLYLTNSEFNLKYVFLVLNSNLIKSYWMSKYSDNKDLFPKIKGYQLKQLPIKNIPLESQKPFIEKVDQMLSLNKELQEVSGKFTRNLEREFSLETLSKKLQSWQQLSYDDFLKELKKQKIELSLSQKADWEDYFQKEKNKAVEIQNQISTTDAEIDKMVYELYGLSEEEILIVENS